MKRRYPSTQMGQTPGGVGTTTPPGAQRLAFGAGVGVGGSIGTTNIARMFGTGLSDPVTWSWIWFALSLGIVLGFPFIFRAGPVNLEI